MGSRREPRRRARFGLAAVRFGPLALAAAALTGCDATSGGGWAGSIETRPDGGVRVTNPADGLWNDSTRWRLVHDLTIGAVDEPIEEVFSSISAIEVDRAGRVYVLDRRYNELRVFGPDGGFLRGFGRAGQGPGEYTSANGLAWLTPDSIVVVDQEGARYSVLSTEDGYARSVGRELAFYAWAFRGAVRDGFVYELTGIQERDRRILTYVRASLLDPALPPDTIPIPPAPEVESDFFHVSNGGADSYLAVPFAPRAVKRLQPRGVWHGYGSDFALALVSLEGDTLADVSLATPAIPVTEAEVDAWLAADFAQEFLSRGGTLDRNRIPRTKPFFDDVAEDPAGNLWISMPAEPNTIVFAVLDPEHRYLGRVRIEGARRSTTVPLVVRDDALYFVARGDLDVEEVHRYRIER